MTLPRRLALALVPLTLTCLSAPPARADLAPPDDTKYVGFEFVVKGAPTSGDLVLVAYPCSTSNGAPMREAKAIGDGPVSVGRRGGDCRLFAAPRADFEKLVASLPQDRAPRDAALKSFFDKAKECEGKPSLTFALPKRDPRDVVREELTVVELSAARCKIAPLKAGNTTSATAAPSAAPSATTAATTPSATTAATTPSATPPSVPTAGGPPPARTGCSAAPAPASADLASVLGLGLGLATAMAARRRRRG
jgi:hypothetical protein